ncbi:hemolysin family protein [Paraburkholderia sp. SARCC-3016]|uniref:hemolysin family protein n=1 Tax=Paraburkholderia sp. SARCC-3016 TaxID=3058611 RepID=UPI002806D980|nr:hemolysin family protein [Paraburkholderia sp. SARCC-3016]MDQ7979877.1 hemolysin family protein [Paraburkholderia sp. SARCC-3016]
MEALILLGLIMLNGVFAMSEIALVTARKARLMKLAAAGDSAAIVALKLGEDPTRFLSTVQIGITSIGLLSGILGEAVLAIPLERWLESLGVPQKTAEIGSTAVVVVAITYVSIIIGELVPKRLGQINPEPIARMVARPMQVLAVLTRPFVVLLSWSTHAVLRMLGVRQNGRTDVTEEEIHALLREGSEAGVIEQHEHDMVRNVFRLDDRRLGSLMIPRSDMVYLDIRLPDDQNLQRAMESAYSRFPVCDGGPDQVLGVIHAKQVLARIAKGLRPDYATGLEPAIYLPETLTGMELLEQFRMNNMNLAFVIDEYGEIQGIVTLHDVLEALTGEFTPRNASDAWAVPGEDGAWVLDGAIPIPETMDRLQLRHVPEEDKARYHTLSGMLMLLLGRVPAAGDYTDWEGWRFEIVAMDRKRIEKVLAKQLLDGNRT